MALIYFLFFALFDLIDPVMASGLMATHFPGKHLNEDLNSFSANVQDSNGTNTTQCIYGNQWIWIHLSQCIEGTLGWTSFGIGMASCAAWMVVLMPQIMENMRNLKNAAPISWGLLACWFLGDANNLVGAVLTNQGIFQEAIGCWFVFTDIILLTQKIAWYLRYHQPQKRALKSAAARTGTVVLCVALLALSPWLGLGSNPTYEMSGARRGRTLLFDTNPDLPIVPLGPFFTVPMNIVGFVMGCLSCVLYTCSRLSQILKNWRKRDVTGLTVWTFVLCVLGNVLYGTAIMVYSLDKSYLIEHLPWIYGSYAIVLMDSYIVYQVMTYSNNFNTLLVKSVNVDIPNEDDDDEEAQLLQPEAPEADQYGTLNRNRH